MYSKCLHCNGKGKSSEVVWLFWLRSVECPKCGGTGRRTTTTSQTSSGTDQPSQPFFEDEIISVPVAKHQAHEESIVGHGGTFGGGGATATWSDPVDPPAGGGDPCDGGSDGGD